MAINREVKNFTRGTIDKVEKESIPVGSASRSENWLTLGDRIELRRGYKILGTEQTGTGSTPSVYVARQEDGTQILWITFDRKIKYFKRSTEDFVEVGSDQLPAGASGEEVSFAEYNGLAGAQLWLNSPNSSLYKVMIANPGDITDMFDSTKNFKGRIKIKNNRMWLYARTADKTGIYGSYIDVQNFTTVSSEALTDVASGTLAFKGAGAKRTCFAVQITDTSSGEVFTDDYNGILTGDAGSTGTINYTTGAFTTTSSGAGTADYQWEDSTDNGIADYTKSATRTAGQGFVFRQDDGGAETQDIQTYQDTEYCIHKLKTWALTLTNDDTNATNDVFREKVGIPAPNASVATGDGIYYIDYLDEKDPQFRLLTLQSGSSKVIPRSISRVKDLSDYRFDLAQGFEWGDLIGFVCRHKDSTTNNAMFLYNRIWKSFDLIKYDVNKVAVYDGVLVGGDSLSNNALELFSGFDDNGTTIINFWEGNLWDLDLQRLKKTKRLVIEGNIDPDQSIDVYLSFDHGGFSKIGTVSGNATYVDRGQAVSVGSVTMGSREIGGGGDGISAFHYLAQFKVRTDKFDEVSIKFIATGVGFASISLYEYKDVRLHRDRTPRKYNK